MSRIARDLNHGSLRHAEVAGTQSTTVSGDHPFYIKHPQDNFSLQNVNRHLPKCKLATSNLQLFYRNRQKSPHATLHFGGRHFAFWRLKIALGVLYRKGGDPQKGWHFGFSLGGATGNDQSRPRKNPRASNRTSRRFSCGKNP